MTQVPDFIPAMDGDHQVGWIWASDVMPAPGGDRADVIAVFADDLTTVVGHIYPKEGFVRLGDEAEFQREQRASREITVSVHNATDSLAILEIIEAPDEVVGPPQLIAPPLAIDPGTAPQAVLRAPRDRWALRVRGGDGFLYVDSIVRASDATIVIGSDGKISLTRVAR